MNASIYISRECDLPKAGLDPNSVEIGGNGSPLVIGELGFVVLEYGSEVETVAQSGDQEALNSLLPEDVSYKQVHRHAVNLGRTLLEDCTHRIQPKQAAPPQKDSREKLHRQINRAAIGWAAGLSVEALTDRKFIPHTIEGVRRVEAELKGKEERQGQTSDPALIGQRHKLPRIRLGRRSSGHVAHR